MIKKLELNLSDYFFDDIIETNIVKITMKNNNFHVNLNINELKNKILNGENIINYNSIIKILKIYNRLGNKNINIEKLLNKIKNKSLEFEKKLSIIEKKIYSKITFPNTNYFKISKDFYLNLKNESFEFIKPTFNCIKNNNVIIHNKNILNSFKSYIKYQKKNKSDNKNGFRYIFLNNFLQKIQLFTKSTLIIAPIFSIELLKTILLNNDYQKLIIIKNKKDFNKYKNIDIINSDFVIINFNIFDSKYFENTNIITNKLIINKLIIMMRNKNIKENFINNFHIFYWNKIIFYNIDFLISKKNQECIYKDKYKIYENIYWLSSNIKYNFITNITNNVINKLITFNDYYKFKYKNQKENNNNYNSNVKKIITKKFLIYNSDKQKKKVKINNKIIYSNFSFYKSKIYKLLNLIGENINNIYSFISSQDNYLLKKIIKPKEYIDQFIEKYNNKKVIYNKECPICLKEIKSNRIILYCGHTLCLSCFLSSLENNINKCCLCRKDYKNNNFFLLEDKPLKNNNKFEKILNYIEKNKKYIIFSNFSINLNKISKYIKKKDSKIKIYKYNNYNISSFEKFNSKKEGILLLEKKFFFENLYINNINKIILLDPYIKNNNIRDFERKINKNIEREDKELIYFLVKNSDEEKYYNKNIKIENNS